MAIRPRVFLYPYSEYFFKGTWWIGNSIDRGFEQITYCHGNTHWRSWKPASTTGGDGSLIWRWCNGGYWCRFAGSTWKFASRMKSEICWQIIFVLTWPWLTHGLAGSYHTTPYSLFTFSTTYWPSHRSPIIQHLSLTFARVKKQILYKHYILAWYWQIMQLQILRHTFFFA